MALHPNLDQASENENEFNLVGHGVDDEISEEESAPKSAIQREQSQAAKNLQELIKAERADEPAAPETRNMTDEEAFLDAICTNPDDDTPRLVYADWLQEQGGSENEAKAEFIRVQCGFKSAPDIAPLQKRAEEIVKAYGLTWKNALQEKYGILNGITYGDAFSRGFPFSLTIGNLLLFEGKITDKQARESLEEALRHAPVEQLVIDHPFAPDELKEVLITAQKHHVRRLYLGGYNTNSHLEGLQNIGELQCLWLDSSPNLPRQDFSDIDQTSLKYLRPLTKLKFLDIQDTSITDDELASALEDPTFLPNIKTIAGSGERTKEVLKKRQNSSQG